MAWLYHREGWHCACHLSCCMGATLEQHSVIDPRTRVPMGIPKLRLDLIVLVATVTDSDPPFLCLQ